MAKHTQTIRPQIDFDSTGTYNENIESIVYRRHPIWRISVFSRYSYKKKKKKKEKKGRQRRPWNCILLFTITIPDRSMVSLDQTGIFSAYFTKQTVTDSTYLQDNLYKDQKAIVNFSINSKSKVILQIECMTHRLQGYNLNFEICNKWRKCMWLFQLTSL